MGSWVDLVIISLLLIFFLDSFRKSFLSETLDFVSFLLALFLSLAFYNKLGLLYEALFKIPHSLAGLVGFATIWFLVEMILFGLLQFYLSKLEKLAAWDKKLQPLSVIPALMRGLIFISIILVLVGTFPIQPQVKLAVQQSRIGSILLSKTQQLENPLKNLFGGLTDDTLSFFTVKPKSNESVALGFTTTDFEANSELEAEMIDLVNKERTSKGLKALVFSAPLQAVARGHSQDMFRRGYFSHYSPEGKTVADRAQEKNVNFFVIGENLAYAPSLKLAHNGLMNSEGHRANILSPDYNKIGIGIMDGGVYGLMITQVFSN